MATRIHHELKESEGVAPVPQQETEDPVARQLEEARSADSTWRADRSGLHQQRIDRAHAWETTGRRWTRSAVWGMFVGGVLYVGAFLFLSTLFGGRNPGGIIASLNWLAGFVAPYLTGQLVLGLCFHTLGRARRHAWLALARHGCIEVTDPGDVPLLDPHELHPPD